MISIRNAREALNRVTNYIECTPERLQFSDDLETLKKFIENTDEYMDRSISWSVEDFEYIAKEDVGKHWREKYDPSKFEDALYDMINKHDAEHGISWENVRFYLDEKCLRDIEDEEIDEPDFVVRNASDESCISCGGQADVFWPVNIDPDIKALPYCNKCITKEEIKLRKALLDLSFNIEDDEGD